MPSFQNLKPATVMAIRDVSVVALLVISACVLAITGHEGAACTAVGGAIAYVRRENSNNDVPTSVVAIGLGVGAGAIVGG